MIGLKELQRLNNAPPKIRDNFNRDSSFVQSALGYVIHSGIHRSTAFVSLTDHADCWHAFGYWKQQGQAAINAFVEVIIDGGELETAEENAFRKSRPDWQVVLPNSNGSQGNRQITAVKVKRGFETRVGAFTFRHLHSKTN